MRYLKAWLLLVLLFFVVHAHAKMGDGEEYSIIEKDDKKGLVNKKGRVLIPPEYEDLGWTNGGAKLLEDVIGFKKDGLWGVLNTRNEKITAPVFRSLARFNENFIIASRKLSYNSSIVYGVINARGNEVIAFEYHNLHVHNDQLIATVDEDSQYVYGVLDDHGRSVLPFRFDRVTALAGELYLAKLDKQVAVFDSEGANLTGFTLDSAHVLTPDYILTFKDGKSGLIGADGEVVHVPSYRKIIVKEGIIQGLKLREWKAYNHNRQELDQYFYDEIIPKGADIYKVKIGNAEALIDGRDSLLTPFTNFSIQDKFENWIAVKKEGRAGVLQTDGSMFIEPVYDSVRYVRGVFLVKHKQEGRRGWSILNKKGEIISGQMYNRLEWMGDSYFKAFRDDYWGVVNSSGKEIIFCKYDSIVEYSGGKLLVRFLGESGILNMDGNWEILPQSKDIEIVDPIRYLIRSPFGSYVAFYPETKDFTAEYFLYRFGKKYLEKTLDLKMGLLDEHGARVIKPVFDQISELYEDSIYYAKSENGYSFISKSGLILNSNDKRFQDIQAMSEQYIGVKIDDRWGFVDANGDLRVANQYENVGPYSEGLAPIKILGRWGYIDKRERLVVQPLYDTAYSFSKGLCIVVKKGKFGLINSNGTSVIDCEYDDISPLRTGGLLTRRNQLFGLISSEGKLLILPKFSDVTDLANGYVIASRRGRFGLLSNDGVNVIPMIYDQVKYDRYRDIYFAAGADEWEAIVTP